MSGDKPTPNFTIQELEAELNWYELEAVAYKAPNRIQPWREWEIKILKRFYSRYAEAGTALALNTERKKRGLKERSKASIGHKARSVGLGYGDEGHRDG